MRLAGPGLSSVTAVSQVTRRRRRGGGRCGRKGERVDEEQEYTVQISRVKGRRKRDRDSWEILRPDTIDQSTDKPARCVRRAQRQQRQEEQQQQQQGESLDRSRTSSNPSRSTDSTRIAKRASLVG